MPSFFTSRDHRMEISPALRGRPATCGCGSALASTERIPVSAAPPSAAPAVLRKSLFFILELLSFCLISFLGAQSLASVSSAREDGVVSKDFVGLGTFFSRYLELCQRCLPAREAALAYTHGRFTTSDRKPFATEKLELPWKQMRKRNVLSSTIAQHEQDLSDVIPWEQVRTDLFRKS